MGEWGLSLRRPSLHTAQDPVCSGSAGRHRCLASIRGADHVLFWAEAGLYESRVMDIQGHIESK